MATTVIYGPYFNRYLQRFLTNDCELPEYIEIWYKQRNRVDLVIGFVSRTVRAREVPVQSAAAMIAHLKKVGVDAALRAITTRDGEKGKRFHRDYPLPEVLGYCPPTVAEEDRPYEDF